MQFFIKEWPDGTATLMTENGQVLWHFPSCEEAEAVCREWYQAERIEENDIRYCA